MHNFADDDNLYACARKLSNIIRLLEFERNMAVNWFTSNKMIVNSNKFQAIITRLIVIDIASLTVLFYNCPLFCNCPLADS